MLLPCTRFGPLSNEATRMRWRSIAVCCALALGIGCGSGDGGSASDETPMTEQERRAQDSAVAESGLPGARGVRGAMNAADSAKARQATMDSLLAEP